MLNVENWQRQKSSKPLRWMRLVRAGRRTPGSRRKRITTQRERSRCSSLAMKQSCGQSTTICGRSIIAVFGPWIDRLRRERKLAKEAEARFHTAEEHDLILEEQRRTIEETLKVTTKDQKGDLRFKTPEEIRGGLGQAGELIANFKKTYEGFGATSPRSSGRPRTPSRICSGRPKRLAASVQRSGGHSWHRTRFKPSSTLLQQEAANRVIKVPVMADVARVDRA